MSSSWPYMAWHLHKGNWFLLCQSFEEWNQLFRTKQKCIELSVKIICIELDEMMISWGNLTTKMCFGTYSVLWWFTSKYITQNWRIEQIWGLVSKNVCLFYCFFRLFALVTLLFSIMCLALFYYSINCNFN